MAKERRLRINKLGTQLTISALLCMVVALCVFYLMQSAASFALTNWVSDSDFYQAMSRRFANRVQQYVTENHISLSNLDALDNMQGDILISVYQDDVLLYDSLGADPTIEPLPRGVYPLSFVDGEAWVYIWDYGFYTVYFRVFDMISALFAFFSFVILFVFLIHKKLNYILRLENELAILEGGNLQYPITIQGNDELTCLAQGIDDMRRSFIERQQGEAEAIRANHALITAMSHDLRTPLTSLTGYIELLQNQQYATEEQRQYFIQASRDKVFRIKEMTDALFEYALCSGDVAPAQLEAMDAYELLSQFVEEYGFELEGAGFQLERAIPPFQAQVLADPSRLSRVFDNLTSNLKKYADPAYPIQVSLSVQRDQVEMVVANQTRHYAAVESTRIGLKTCQSILQQHGGGFQTSMDGSRFQARLVLPLLQGD